MNRLNMESTIKNKRGTEKKVFDLVKEKGKILSLIKEGYDFEDEVLSAAHIKRNIRDVKVSYVVGNKDNDELKPLQKDTTSARQIIYELNTINNDSNAVEKGNEDAFSNYNNQIDTINFEEDE